MSIWDDKPFREELEKLGEAEVKSIIARGDQWANLQNRGTVAQLWLREKEESRRDERDKRMESIAQEANRIAARAERWAMYATIASVIALIISIINRKF